MKETTFQFMVLAVLFQILYELNGSPVFLVCSIIDWILFCGVIFEEAMDFWNQWRSSRRREKQNERIRV